ncbi:MAG: DUF6250 domain-containing protein [Reichenbachiella sp.]|uniref:DUF6250 domain-containing protein n=1 Tax=Reichenbachiella sp. TaxID=2184521 RepID=UPI00329795CF
MNSLNFLFVVISAMIACEAPNHRIIKLTDGLSIKAELLLRDDFSNGIDNWQAEQMPGGTVYGKDGKLVVKDKAGCTVWFKNKLNGPIMIEYDAYVVEAGGAFDRVSDLNCFWMATDSEHPDNLFAKSESRNGKFRNYDSLSLYYVGMGGHHNTKTRFRRYNGKGEKPLLPQHDLTDSAYQIKPNTAIKIRLIAYKDIIQFYKNDKLIFDFQDPNPYTEGHFGLRTVHNHMMIDNFAVYQLTEIAN